MPGVFLFQVERTRRKMKNFPGGEYLQTFGCNRHRLRLKIQGLFVNNLTTCHVFFWIQEHLNIWGKKAQITLRPRPPMISKLSPNHV